MAHGDLFIVEFFWFQGLPILAFGRNTIAHWKTIFNAICKGILEFYPAKPMPVPQCLCCGDTMNYSHYIQEYSWLPHFIDVVLERFHHELCRARMVNNLDCSSGYNDHISFG